MNIAFVYDQQSIVVRVSSTVETGRGACRVHVTAISQSQDRTSASTVPDTLRLTPMAQIPVRNVKVNKPKLLSRPPLLLHIPCDFLVSASGCQ